MEIVKIPVEVYALIENEWSRVIGVSPVDGFVAVVVKGEHRAYPPEDTYKWDLLWPKTVASQTVFL